MNLTREIRKRIMAGDCPFIGGEGISPIKAGHVWRLSKYVTVEVTRVDHSRGKWSARYVVRDSRDLKASADRYLRRVPRPEDFEALRDTFDAHGYPAQVGDDEVDAAAAESAYTNRADLAIDPSPVVDADFQAKLSKSVESSNAQLRAKQRAKSSESLNQLIARFRAELAEMDDSPEARKMKRKAERLFREAA